MFQSEVLFKVSKLQVIEITNSSIQMNDSYITFYIEGTDSDTTYSFQFESFITIEELKQLEVDQEIDFQKYVQNLDELKDKINDNKNNYKNKKEEINNVLDNTEKKQNSLNDLYNELSNQDTSNRRIKKRMSRVLKNINKQFL